MAIFDEEIEIRERLLVGIGPQAARHYRKAASDGALLRGPAPPGGAAPAPRPGAPPRRACLFDIARAYDGEKEPLVRHQKKINW